MWLYDVIFRFGQVSSCVCEEATKSMISHKWNHIFVICLWNFLMTGITLDHTGITQESQYMITLTNNDRQGLCLL